MLLNHVSESWDDFLEAPAGVAGSFFQLRVGSPAASLQLGRSLTVLFDGLTLEAPKVVLTANCHVFFFCFMGKSKQTPPPPQCHAALPPPSKK